MPKEELDLKRVSMEFTKLHLEPDELLLIRPKDKLRREEAGRWTEIFRGVLQEAGIHNKILLIPPGVDFGKISGADTSQLAECLETLLKERSINTDLLKPDA